MNATTALIILVLGLAAGVDLVVAGHMRGKLSKNNNPMAKANRRLSSKAMSSPTPSPSPVSPTAAPTMPPGCVCSQDADTGLSFPADTTAEQFQAAVSEYISTGTSQYGNNITCWDTSQVTNMAYAFFEQAAFNEPLSCWNVASVTDMSSMFRYAETFNQPLNDWNVASVGDMERMFNNAYHFNQPLHDWDVRSVNNANYMFAVARAFNQDLCDWDGQILPSPPGSTSSDYGMFSQTSCEDTRMPSQSRNWCAICS